jgi:hypothetical protein
MLLWSEALAATPEGYLLTAENSGLKLYADKATGQFALVADNQTEWLSNPSDAVFMDELKGSTRNRILSIFTAVVLNPETGRETTAHSNLLALDGNMAFAEAESGYSLTFTPEGGLSFTIEISLSNGFLSVRLPLDKLREGNGAVLSEITLLPAFGAGGASDSGFLLIPDGSGAIINFNNGKKGSYAEPVYGPDQAFIREAMAVSKEDATFPIYGIERNGAGILGILHKGAAIASIHAASAGNGSVYNTACPKFILRRKDTQSIAADASQTVYESSLSLAESPELRLYPSPDQNSGYNGMARTLRGYLENELGMRPVEGGEMTTALSIYGGVEKKVKLLGVPLWSATSCLTSYADARSIVSDFYEAGAGGLSVELLQWELGQISGRAAKTAKPPQDLGGAYGLSELASYCKSIGAKLFAGVSLSFYKNSSAGSVSRDSIRNLPQEPSKQHDYSKSSYAADPATVRYLLKAGKADDNLRVFNQSISEYGFYGISFTDIGNLLYGDYDNRSPYSLQSTARVFEGTLSESAQTGAVLTHGGHLYAAALSDIILDVPLGGSGLSYSDTQVPFCQMALSGLAYYAAPAVNSSANQRDALLFSLESGGLAAWGIVGSDTKGTRLSDLYYADYALNKEWMLEVAKALAPALKETAGRRIVSHDIVSDTSRVTVYDNGAVARVDYSTGEFSVEKEGERYAKRLEEP